MEDELPPNEHPMNFISFPQKTLSFPLILIVFAFTYTSHIHAASVQPSLTHVRIALSLTTFKKSNTKDLKNRYFNKPLPAQKHTLRATINAPNHFYFGNWHIVTRPVMWAKQTHQYKTHITIFQRFGRKKEVEEKIGTIEASGTLKPYKDFYVLQNYQKKTFADRKGNPRLVVAIGFDSDIPNIAKLRKKKRRTPRL